MQLRLEIICPFHQHQEVLTLPESYSVDFSGEVPCGAERHQATLYIALTVGEVKELRLVESPLLFRLYKDADPRPERVSAEPWRPSPTQPARRRADLVKGASTPRLRSRRLGPG